MEQERESRGTERESKKIDCWADVQIQLCFEMKAPRQEGVKLSLIVELFI